ncbi:MAG: hypothetical protein OEY97_05025 [Nitrospirota bacterium]|nr:hypothetical protein [Nitrospirota bacterium]
MQAEFQNFRWLRISLAAMAAGLLWAPAALALDRGALALDTGAVTRATSAPVVANFTFNVPVAGAAMLKVANGVMDDEITGEKVSSSVIALNGQVILGPDQFNQAVSEVSAPVTLLEGANTLSVELRGKPGGVIIARVVAPVDAVHLIPPAGPVVIGSGPLEVHASASGLGLPAQLVALRFDVDGLGAVQPAQTETGKDGAASAMLDGFSTPGTGSLWVTVEVYPERTDSTPLTVVSPGPDLPPDPGEVGKLTLMGIDSDGDGVRDDVQRYIVLEVAPGNEPMIRALLQKARVYQRLLLEAEDPEASRHNADRLIKATECMLYVDDVAGPRLSKKVTGKLLNTRERSLRYFQFEHHLAGATISTHMIEDYGRFCE